MLPANTFNLHDDDQGEYSIEIDPREVTADSIKLLRDIGFNRMSLGVQDFDPKVQKAVNRIQGEDITLNALQTARDTGFKSISVDLIYGLPFQNVASFSETLTTHYRDQSGSHFGVQLCPPAGNVQTPAPNQ